MEQIDRWIELRATSPSGKMLFSCQSCGRVSVLPDKTCPNIQAGRAIVVPCEYWPLTADDIKLIGSTGGGLLIGKLTTLVGSLRVKCLVTEKIADDLQLLQIEDDLRYVRAQTNG